MPALLAAAVALLAATIALAAPVATPAPADSGVAPADSARANRLNALLSGAVQAADPLAATGQTVDAVKWMARRRQFSVGGRPYGLTGLPIAYYSPSTGWNYGGQLQLSDYSRRPYRYKLTLHWATSTGGKRNTDLRLKVPHIAGTGFGFQVGASTKRDIRARYFGRSNDSRFDQDLIDPASAEYIDEDYYYYTLEGPRLLVSLLRHVYGPVTLSLDLGVGRTDIDPSGPRSYYLEEGTPDGVVDGVTGVVGTTLTWDTRDDPTIPKRGTFHEWAYETSRNGLLSLFFEEIDFQRFTFTDARYWPKTQRLNIAHRTIYEVLRGAVPLYAYGEIGGSRRIKGVGGSDTLRGYDRQRFTDDIRLLTNTEARYYLGSRVAFKQYLELHGVLFLDTGQVANQTRDLRPLATHVTVGWGLRTYWNSDFVLRADFGISPEQIYAALKYRGLF